MYDLLAAILSFFYDLVPSYGFAIIMLTLVLMIVLAPFTVRQTRSMLAMQRLQPEVKRLRAKYGNDRERMNQEMMALYQANGVNPLGGCLPLLIQAPVLFVMYRVVQGLTRRVSEQGLSLGFFSSHTNASSAGSFPDRPFNPDHLDHGTKLFQDLDGATQMKSFGIDLAESAQGSLSSNFVEAIPYLLLVIGVGITTFVQQRQISQRQKARGGKQELDPQQQQTQAILKIMPFMLPVISFGFPAALVLYWFVSNVFRVGQQAFITRRVYGTHDDEAEIVRPSSDDGADDDASDPAPSPARGGTGSKATVNHGSRRPVSNPPKKKARPKPSSSSSTGGSSSGKKSSTQQARASSSAKKRQSQTSRRVTPKQRATPEPTPPASSGRAARSSRKKRK